MSDGTHPGKEKGEDQRTWSVETELRDMGMTWGEAEILAKDRQTWEVESGCILYQ